MPQPHRTVKIPIELYKHVAEIVEQGRFGYRNKNEFVKEAIRRYLIELGIFDENTEGEIEIDE